MSYSPLMSPPPMLGSGEVEGRYAQRFELTPYPPQPWYYDQTKSTFAAGIVIIAIVAVALMVG